jgi:hypothetical protein
VGFLDRSRTSATVSGFGAARAKVAEMLETRLDEYIEDLLHTIRSGEVADLDCAQALLETAAGFVGVLHGDKAAQIVRRRAAA